MVTVDDEAADESSATRSERKANRRRVIDLTRRDKGLPERRNLGTDRRAPDDDDPTGQDTPEA